MRQSRPTWLQLIAGIGIELLRILLVALIAGLFVVFVLAIFFGLAWLAVFA